MPTIKCSSCARQVEISMMGEHLCTGGGGADSIDTFMPFDKAIHDQISVIPPINTAVASTWEARDPLNPQPANNPNTDRSYMRAPLTPLSFTSTSRSASPRTPSTRPSIGRAEDYFSPKIASHHSTASQSSRPDFGDAYEEPMYPAMSPNKQAPSLLTRMNTIAPGPFGSGGRDLSPIGGTLSTSAPNGYENERPGTSASMSSNGTGSMGPPRLPRKNGYEGFGPPQRDEPELDSFGAPNRARTFPRAEEGMEAPLRTPSAPGPRPDRYRHPSAEMPRMGPDTSRAPPPRTSAVRAPSSTRGGSNPPGINLADEFGVGNPYHSPSVSVSSSRSASSRPSNPSSSTSPARSATSARKPTSFDNLMDDIQASMDELQPKELPPTPELRGGPNLAEDRYDPAVQGGRRPPSPPPSSKWDSSARDDPAIQAGPRSKSRARAPALPPSPKRSPVPRSRVPAVQPSRGNCKSCGDAITGKSISSADGRLTGRYHKACFGCTSCREPFETAEFYVHGDRPYCKRHYHRMNGSLCGSCGDGIEGQYLEDESTMKFHVNCFRCGDCKVVLRDGYFEVNGNAYCEKDAWRRMQPQNYRRSPSMSSQRSHGSSNLAPPGLPGRSNMRGMSPSRPPPMGGRPGPGYQGLAPPGMPRMEKRMTKLGMMGMM